MIWLLAVLGSTEDKGPRDWRGYQEELYTHRESGERAGVHGTHGGKEVSGRWV